MLKKFLISSLLGILSTAFFISGHSPVLAEELSISDGSSLKLQSGDSGIFTGNATTESKFIAEDGINIGDNTSVISSVTKNGAGTLEFLGSSVASGNIGASSNKLYKLLINSSETSHIIFNGDIFSNNFEMKKASKATVNGNINSDNIIFTGDKTIELSANKNITGNIKSFETEKALGILKLTGGSGSASLIDGTIGNEFNKIKTLNIGDTELNITHNIYAGTININNGILNLTKDAHGNIKFSNDGLIIVKDTSNIFGNIFSSAENTGNINLKGSSKISGTIGSLSAPLNQITLGSDNTGNLKLKNDLFAKSLILDNNSVLDLSSNTNIYSTITTGTANEGNIVIPEGEHSIAGNIGNSGSYLNSIIINNSINNFEGNIYTNNMIVDNESSIIIEKEKTLTASNNFSIENSKILIYLGGDLINPVIDSQNTTSLNNTEIIINPTTLNNVSSVPTIYKIISSGSPVSGTPEYKYNSSYIYSIEDVTSNPNEVTIAISETGNSFSGISEDTSPIGATIDSYIKSPIIIADKGLSSNFDQIIINSLNQDEAKTNLQKMNPLIDNYVIDNLKLMNKLNNENIENYITEIHIKNSEHKNLNQWTQVFYSDAEQKLRDDVPGYSANSYGVILGMDKELSDNNKLGLAVSYLNSDSKSYLDKNSGFETESYIMSIYNNYYVKEYNLYIDSILNTGLHKYDSIRNLPDNTLASGEWDAMNYNGRIKISYDKPLKNNIYIKPNIALNVGYLSHDAYNEKNAGSANLHVENESNTLVSGSLGLDLSYRVKSPHADLIPHISFDLLFDAFNDNLESHFFLEGNNSEVYIIESPDPASLNFNIEAGLSIYSQDNIDLHAEYLGLFREDYSTNSAILKLIYNF